MTTSATERISTKDTWHRTGSSIGMPRRPTLRDITPESDDDAGFELPFQLQAAAIGSVMGMVVLLLTVLVMRTLRTTMMGLAEMRLY